MNNSKNESIPITINKEYAEIIDTTIKIEIQIE